MATLRQKLAMKKISENVGNSSLKMGKVLKEAGYSESVCKTPQRVTKTKGWNQLFEEYLPEDLLFQKHRKLLDSKEPRDVIAALTLAYKIKGFYKGKEPEVPENDFSNWTIEELKNYIYKETAKKTQAV